MTRIQRIDMKANAVHLRVVAGFLAERALERAGEGAIGLAKECAHLSRKLHSQARNIERKAKSPYVWTKAATMPPFVLSDFYHYSVSWLLDNPAAIFLIAAVLFMAAAVTVTNWRLVKKDALQMRKSLRLTAIEDAREETRARAKRDAVLLRGVARRMERDGNEAA